MSLFAGILNTLTMRVGSKIFASVAFMQFHSSIDVSDYR